MKKIISVIIFSSILGFLPIAQAQMPWDIAYHALPTSIGIDVPEEIGMVSSNLSSTVDQAKQVILQGKAEITNMRTAVTATFNNIINGALLNEDDKYSDSGVSTFCGKDIKDISVDDMAKKIEEVLLTYKENTYASESFTDNARKNFYIDNLYVLYATSIVLQNKMKTDVMTAIVKAQSCAEGKGEECGIPSGDDGGNNEAVFTFAKTLETLDDIVRVWETVAALKARLVAIDTLNSLKPSKAVVTNETSTEEKTTEEQTSFVLPRASSVLRTKEALAFAQISYPKKTSASLADIESKIAGVDDESSMQLVIQKVKFTTPKEPDNAHPLMSATEKLNDLAEISSTQDSINEAISVHNMINGLGTYKEMAEQYADMKKDYEEVLDKLYKSEQCSIRYLSNYFSNPVGVWSGADLGKENYRHEMRKGISGWALEAFETAKAAEVSVITTDDIPQSSLDKETLDDLADDPDFSKAQKQAENTNTSLGASKQEKAQEENRKSALMAWQIGAEAAKLLGNDASKWGSLSGSKMVWTDTKRFYNQYLKLKYENVKKYLKSYTRDDVLALVVAKLNGQNNDISETNYQKQLKKDLDATNLNIASNMQDAMATIKEKDNSSKKELSGIEKQKQSLMAQMDELSLLIKEDMDKIADLRSVAEEKAADDINKSLNGRIVFPDDGQVPQSRTKINDAETLNLTVAQQQKNNTDDEEIEKLNKSIASKQKKLDDYQKRLDNINIKIAETKQLSHSNSIEALNQQASLMTTIQDNLTSLMQKNADGYAKDVRKNLMEILTKKAQKNPLISPVAMLPLMEIAAETSLNALYKQVDAIVDAGYQQLLSMGDKLYATESHIRITEIHKQMISKIKALTLAYSVAGLIKVDNIAVYTKLLATDTDAETEGFFVGATAKARDLKGPFAIPDFSMPHVREVFHFDSTDFAIVKPPVKGKSFGRNVSAEAFLNFGGEIPLVWQYMLKDNAFIERNYGLKEALSGGCEDIAFARGGIMPCLVKGSKTILDVNSNGEYIKRDDISSNGLSECLLVDTKNGKPHHVFWDEDVSFGLPIVAVGSKSEKIIDDENCSYSELGMLLEADENNNLSFRKLAFDTYNTLLADTNNEKLSKKEKNKIAAATHAILSRNQIGDFLKFVESEKLNRENLEEYKQEYDEQIESLKEKLKLAGFTPSDTYDLTKDSDYKLTLNKLKALKKENIAKAKGIISTVDVKDNIPAQERKEAMNKLISIMEKDTECLLQLSMTSANDNNLDEKLKKAKADATVVDKYKKSLKEQYKDYNNPEDPFCANY